MTLLMSQLSFLVKIIYLDQENFPSVDFYTEERLLSLMFLFQNENTDDGKRKRALKSHAKKWETLAGEQGVKKWKENYQQLFHQVNLPIQEIIRPEIRIRNFIISQ